MNGIRARNETTDLRGSTDNSPGANQELGGGEADGEQVVKERTEQETEPEHSASFSLFNYFCCRHGCLPPLPPVCGHNNTSSFY